MASIHLVKNFTGPLQATPFPSLQVSGPLIYLSCFAQRDNIRPYCSMKTKQGPQILRLNTSYAFDLASSDYHIFGVLKTDLERLDEWLVHTIDGQWLTDETDSLRGKETIEKNDNILFYQ